MPDISCQHCLSDLSHAHKYQCSHGYLSCIDCARHVDAICPDCGEPLSLTESRT